MTRLVTFHVPVKEGNSDVVKLYNAADLVPSSYVMSTKLTSTGRVPFNLIILAVVLLEIHCSNCSQDYYAVVFKCSANKGTQ